MPIRLGSFVKSNFTDKMAVEGSLLSIDLRIMAIDSNCFVRILR